jgi:hypothetical protein
LGIGTSPAALALGAGLAERHGGAVSVVGVALGVLLMAVLLQAQGLIGLRPPIGDGGTLSGVAHRYLGGRTLPALHVLPEFRSSWAHGGGLGDVCAGQ